MYSLGCVWQVEHRRSDQMIKCDPKLNVYSFLLEFENQSNIQEKQSKNKQAGVWSSVVLLAGNCNGNMKLIRLIISEILFVWNRLLLK